MLDLEVFKSEGCKPENFLSQLLDQLQYYTVI